MRRPLPVLVGLAGDELGVDEAEALDRHRPLGVLLLRRNVTGRERLQALVARLRERWARWGEASPLLAVDEEGGSVSPLAPAIGRAPAPLALGIAADPSLTRRVHAETAGRARELGVELLLAPVADVLVPGNPVIATRSFGTDPAAVIAHVQAAVRGLEEGGVLACVKHWPGHGRSRVDSHLEPTTIDASLDRLMETDLPPFVAAIRAGVPAVMTGHLTVPAMDAQGRPATVSPLLLTDWLRGRLGFDGAVLSDALEMKAMEGFRALDALHAGCDLLLWGRGILELEEELGALAADLPERRLEEIDERLRALRHSLPIRSLPSAGDEAVWEEARIRGMAALWPEDRSGPAWPPASAGPVRWRLVDAASSDRLLIDPRDGGGRPAISPLLGPLEAHLGSPAASAEVLAPPGGKEAFTPPSEAPEVDGWVIAALRPWPVEEGRELARRVVASGARWVAILGDPGLHTALPPELGILLCPTVDEEAAGLVGRVLVGLQGIVVRDRWGG